MAVVPGRRDRSDKSAMALAPRSKTGDPAELVAAVAHARRPLLMRVHGRRLRFEDLEDCFSQATLELVARARRRPFESVQHVENALEQKFASRINDRRRALGGRSAIEAALAGAVSVESPGSAAGELADPSAEVLNRLSSRAEVRRLREVAGELSADQRLVLACQVSLGMDCSEFCERFGWTSEKFRKVAQRARARLRSLVDEYEMGERCTRIHEDLLAISAGVASTEQLARAGGHLENCRDCARALNQLDRAARGVAAVLPAPIRIKAMLAGAVAAARRLFGPHHTASASIAGGTAGAVKLGAVAACVTGAAAVCVNLGLPALAPRHAPRERPRAGHRAVQRAPASPSYRVALTRPRLTHQATRAPVVRRPHPRGSATARRDFSFEGRFQGVPVAVRHAPPPARAATRSSREFAFER